MRLHKACSRVHSTHKPGLPWRPGEAENIALKALALAFPELKSLSPTPHLDTICHCKERCQRNRAHSGTQWSFYRHWVFAQMKSALLNVSMWFSKLLLLLAGVTAANTGPDSVQHSKESSFSLHIWIVMAVKFYEPAITDGYPEKKNHEEGTKTSLPTTVIESHLQNNQKNWKEDVESVKVNGSKLALLLVAASSIRIWFNKEGFVMYLLSCFLLQ